LPGAEEASLPVDERPDSGTSRGPADPLLTIGQFARRSRLSPKALRLYERLGVLTPAHVDPTNGYRRYRQSQLPAARLVALLRRLDMPLARVAEVIAAPVPRGAALLASYWDEVEHRVASQRELAAYLRVRLIGKEGSFDMFEIRQRDVPEQVVLTEQRHITAGELPTWIPVAMDRLLKSAEDHGGVAGSPFVVYHGEVNEDSDGPVEVCVPVDPAREGAPNAAMRREPAHHEAYTRITKAQVEFPQILAAYEAVDQWIGANGRRMGDSPREVYFADWDAAGPNDEVCDVAFPLQ
jgi:DNA-binding transcriptional MerR regulator